jgi:putative ABC transport system permease protein
VLLMGISLAVGSFGSAVVGGPLLFVLTYIYLRLFEEPCLKKRFGYDYQRYAEQVPIFFPIKQERIPMAVRNLLGDRIRFAVNIIGVSLAVLLISFQLSILKGTRSQITTYIDHTGADIWAMQKGVDDFIATSSLPRESVDVIKKLKGVDKAAGIFAVYTLLQINRVKSRVYVIGYDTKSGVGGPWRLGQTLPHVTDIHRLKKHEVLLDQDLAQRHSLKLGDKVLLFGHSFTVAGFTLETMSIGSQYVFLPRKAVSRILPGGKFSFTHVLVWTNKEMPDEMIIQQIKKDTSLDALTRGRLAANMHDFLGMFMLPLLTAGVVMGFLVGSITIGITLYTSILERFKEYGTIKALGATDLYLYGLLLRQALISLMIGVVLGLMFSVFANHLINQWVPGMTAELDGEIATQTLFAGLGMALLSTGLPAWRLFKLDPLEAFRA